MHAIWNTIIYQPIYNALVFVLHSITIGDVGLAVILLTIVVKLILSPLTKKSIRNQILMKKMEPEINLIKKNFPNKEEQSKKTFELYKKYGTNPFSGCLLIFIQIPIIIALYYVFYSNTSIDTSLLYSFIQTPSSLHTNFLGLFEMGGKSIVLAVLAGLSQFVQAYLSLPIKTKNAKSISINQDGKEEPKDFQSRLADSMQMNIIYILPIMTVFISYKTSAAVALYWITSTIFTIAQEWYIRRKLKLSDK